MNDAVLRDLVREVVARHLARAGEASSARQPSHAQELVPSEPMHASHQMYLTLVNADSACVIEPTVSCNHCGYCKSHGY